MELNIYNLLDKRLNWGEMLNIIQDSAESVLSRKDFHSYLMKAGEDAMKCEDSDFLYLNGDVYDWKEYDRKKESIVFSYLKYFNDYQLNKIYQYMKGSV